jgi:ribonucleoside-diphosphate reductase alpha chain
LVTAECFATSAELAALRGVSPEFADNRESVLRALRNHRRAVYGDGNDYEKLSVLPAPLPLKNCPDLALVAEAQRRWDDALDMARAFGLRMVQTTDLTPSPVLSLLMTSAGQGLEPMQRLTSLRYDEADRHVAVLHPAVSEALARLNYARNDIRATEQHIIGSGSLRKAPGINAASLRASGLSESAIEKIEAYLPCVNTIRLAVTPWIIGVDYCRTQLKIPARALQSPRFDLLRHLGFSDSDVEVANRYCYGFETARNAKSLHLRHRPLFALGAEISTEARIRMAAAVQSFISGDTGLVARLPAARAIACGAETTLSAWRSGLKSLTIVFDPSIVVKEQRQTAARKINAAAQSHAKPMGTPKRKVVAKNAPALVAKKTTGARRGAR